MSEIGKALGQKNGHTELALLAAQYREASEKHRDAMNKDSLVQARITVARAAGDVEMVEKLSRESRIIGETYTARNEAALRLCKAMSIDPREFRSALL